MCGICGIYRLDGSPADMRSVAAMRDRLIHRGPDDAGDWSEGSVAFGFRRLSILDLEGGHQPMVSADGQVAVVFNGEIYNHPQVKSELEAGGAVYRTRSDTETILHLYQRYGADAFVRLNGMFAIALWDRKCQTLFLARDPLGVKPLYYAMDKDRLVFCSELRALLAAGISDEIYPPGVLEYLSYGSVNSPRTVLAQVLKLPPGHLLRLDSKGLRIEKYWEIPSRPRSPARMDIEEAQGRMDHLLNESVRGQMLSDVPLGAFLSGGVDSSLVTALMARASGRSISTFSIGFSGARAGLDESRYARTVSRYLGTDHHELILPAEVLDRMEELVPSLDEPIADSAVLPTYLLARFARQSVKVVLTGEGADELFAGYNRYKAAWIAEHLLGFPGWGRRLAAPLARRLGKGRLFKGLPLDTMQDWARLNAHTAPGVVEAICKKEFLEAAQRPTSALWALQEVEPHSLNGALTFDLKTVLADCLLMKVDKATMQASLEARVPFLDKALVEFAVHLPNSLKIRGFKGKYILRRLAARYLPREIVWRRKHGFVVPWEEWIRSSGNLRIDELIADSSMASRGIFDGAHLKSMRRDLIDGGGEADAGLFFRVVILGLWLESLKTFKRAV